MKRSLSRWFWFEPLVLVCESDAMRLLGQMLVTPSIPFLRIICVHKYCPLVGCPRHEFAASGPRLLPAVKEREPLFKGDNISQYNRLAVCPNQKLRRGIACTKQVASSNSNVCPDLNSVQIGTNVTITGCNL